MRLVDAGSIERAERVFRKSLSLSLDRTSIIRLLKESCDMQLSKEPKFQNMDLLAFNDKVAFRFEILATAFVSFLMSRNGQFLGMEKIAKRSSNANKKLNFTISLLNAKLIREKKSQLVKAIAGAINSEFLLRLAEKNNHSKLINRPYLVGARFAVHQKRLVYNLIYNAEYKVSFLLDDKGEFIDFADPVSIAYESETSTKSSEVNSNLLEQNLLEEEARKETELSESFEEDHTQQINEDEYDAIRNIFLKDPDDYDEIEKVISK